MSVCILKNVLLPAQKRIAAEMDDFEDHILMRSSHVDRTSAQTSGIPYTSLRHIPVAALQLFHRHRGCRVEGTVCCKAIRQVAVQVLLEDAKDTAHAVIVSLYNLVPASASLVQIRRLLPEGTKLAIKEPYYKVFVDGKSGIRVDNPADVIFLADTVQPREVSETADFDDIKAQGNKAFRSGEYAKAQALYKLCLQQRPHNVPILSNLAAVHISLGNFPQALQYAQDGLKEDADHVKCLYRCGVAHTNLEQYSDAIKYLEKAKQKTPEDRTLTTQMSCVEELLQQSKGNFDPDMLFLGKTGRRPLTKLATFIGPVKVASLPGKGRGLVVTQDMKAGQLLFVNNRLAMARVDVKQCGFQLDMLSGHMNDRFQADLVAILADRGMKHPLALPQMYALYDGTKQSLQTTPDVELLTSNSSDPQGSDSKIDTIRIANIVRFNAFGSASISVLFPSGLNLPTGDVGLETAQNRQADLLLREDTKHKWCGLYPLLSMVNHSCCLNSTLNFVREAVMLRAGQDLKAGEEITISYISDAKACRRKTLQESWGFMCKCPRCAVEEALPKHIKRMIATLSDQMSVAGDRPGRIAALYRKAVKMQSKAAFAVPAKELDRLLSELKRALNAVGLPSKQQHWVMFDVLEAFLCQRQCHAILEDKHGLQLAVASSLECLVLQSVMDITALYGSTVPGSNNQIADMVRTVIYAQHVRPGTVWECEAREQAQSALQLRYGLNTAAQKMQALNRALHQSRILNDSSMVVY